MENPKAFELLHTYNRVRVDCGGFGTVWRVRVFLRIVKQYTQPYNLSVSPPVVAVPWGATIIQPSVVNTESNVMRTVKQPWLKSSMCHAEAQHRTSHAHKQKGTFDFVCFFHLFVFYEYSQWHGMQRKLHLLFKIKWKQRNPPRDFSLQTTATKKASLCSASVCSVTERISVTVHSKPLALLRLLV